MKEDVVEDPLEHDDRHGAEQGHQAGGLDTHLAEGGDHRHRQHGPLGHGGEEPGEGLVDPVLPQVPQVRGAGLHDQVQVDALADRHQGDPGSRAACRMAGRVDPFEQILP